VHCLLLLGRLSKPTFRRGFPRREQLIGSVGFPSLTGFSANRACPYLGAASRFAATPPFRYPLPHGPSLALPRSLYAHGLELHARGDSGEAASDDEVQIQQLENAVRLVSRYSPSQTRSLWKFYNRGRARAASFLSELF